MTNPPLINPAPINPARSSSSPAKRIVADLPLKDLLRDGQSLIISSLAGSPVVRPLFTEFARFNMQRADLLFELKNRTLFHPEVQSQNERNIPARLGGYAILIDRDYQLPLRQLVLYIGRRVLRMSDHCTIAGHKFHCPIVDIRNFKADTLLSSGFPADIVLAILADGGEKRIQEILERIAVYDSERRKRAASLLFSLAPLRDNTSTILKRARSRMPIYLEDLKESILFKEGEQLGQQRGEQIGQQRGEQIGQQRAAAQHREQLIDLLATALKSRFDRVPATYTKRMQTATSDQLCRWIANVATAIDLPSVFRK